MTVRKWWKNKKSAAFGSRFFMCRKSDIYKNLTGINDSSSDSSLNDCSKPAAYKHDNLAEYGQFGTINGQIGRQMNFGTFIATLRV